jgi:hypothetical protein
VRPIYLAFAAMLILAGLTVIVLTGAEPLDSAGVNHPTFPDLKMGGKGADKLASLGMLPFVFQLVVYVLAACLLYMGVPERRRDGFLKGAVVGMFFVTVLVWVKTYLSYLAFLETGTVEIFLGFPEPTAWMLYGIWGGFGVYCLFYVIFFKRYFLYPDDLQSFNDLVSDMKQNSMGEQPDDKGAV